MIISLKDVTLLIVGALFGLALATKTTFEPGVCAAVLAYVLVMVAFVRFLTWMDEE